MPVHAMSSCIQQTGGSYLAYRTWAGFLKNWPPLDLEDYSAAHSPMFLFQFAAARRRHKRSIAPFQDPRHFSRRYFYLFLCWAALRGRRPRLHNHTPNPRPAAPLAAANRPLPPDTPTLGKPGSPRPADPARRPGPPSRRTASSATNPVALPSLALQDMRPSPRPRVGRAWEPPGGGAPGRVRGRADGARPRAAGGAHGARRRRRRQGRRRGVGEVEERRERGGKRAQGRAVVINSGY